MTKLIYNIRIGTSGWHYNHWQGRFYPDNLPKSRWLDFYAQFFDTVEINNTFYHLPKAQTFQTWHKQASKSFFFAVKANRYITHIKRLIAPKDSLNHFFERVFLLKQNLGPVLYQLPPNFHKDLKRLADFLHALPKDLIAVFEFRHDSWFSDDTYSLLKDFNAAFCIHDLPGSSSPKIVTSDTIYLRFHGTTSRYAGNYSDKVLKEWAHWIKKHLENVSSVYIYFNNDYNAYAVKNARQLREILLSLF